MTVTDITTYTTVSLDDEIEIHWPGRAGCPCGDPLHIRWLGAGTWSCELYPCRCDGRPSWADSCWYRDKITRKMISRCDCSNRERDPRLPVDCCAREVWNPLYATESVSGSPGYASGGESGPGAILAPAWVEEIGSGAPADRGLANDGRWAVLDEVPPFGDEPDTWEAKDLSPGVSRDVMGGMVGAAVGAIVASQPRLGAPRLPHDAWTEVAGAMLDAHPDVAPPRPSHADAWPDDEAAGATTDPRPDNAVPRPPRVDAWAEEAAGASRIAQPIGAPPRPPYVRRWTADELHCPCKTPWDGSKATKGYHCPQCHTNWTNVATAEQHQRRLTGPCRAPGTVVDTTTGRRLLAARAVGGLEVWGISYG